jgi:NADPH:quinone reductase-like Zn-dependent oxidoreductase
MKAAVVRQGGAAPVYGDFEEPAARDGEVIVTVRASALSNVTRGQAAGTHYSSEGGADAFVPGFDGAGALADGTRVYFAAPRRPFGAMAERAPVRRAVCVKLPDGVDDVTAAAIANPGMSSWAALTERAKFVAGESVLVNGATGTAGKLAVQIAKHLGAAKLVATGRNPAALAALPALGADRVISLDDAPDRLVTAFRDAIRDNGVSVVLDYLWGPPAERIIAAIAGDGGDASRRIRYVEIGAMAGRDITLPSAALRSSALEILGSGLGSVPFGRLIACVGALMEAVVPAGLAVATETAPLRDVAAAWNRKTGNNRLVFTV